MNEKLAKEKLGQLVEYLTESAKQGIDFTKEQAPLVAQEIVQWTIGESAVLIVSGLIGLGIGAYLLRLGIRGLRDDWGGLEGLPIAGGVMLSSVSILMVVTNTLTLVKAITAPRLVLLDYLGKLLK